MALPYSATEQQLCFTFGDTATWDAVIDNGADPPVAIDVTGFAFNMGVGLIPNPTSVGELVFTTSATLVTPASGLIRWGFTALNWAAVIAALPSGSRFPQVLFYDVQQTDAGGRDLTIGRGAFVVNPEVYQT